MPISRLFYFFAILLLYSCVKELEGPNSLAPQDPQKYGKLMVFTDWVGFDTSCANLSVTLDGEYIGVLTQARSQAECFDAGTLTLDSIMPGIHNVYVECGSVDFPEQLNVLADQCNIVKISR